jgi:uncharacterized protein YktB (UPF0637 family)
MTFANKEKMLQQDVIVEGITADYIWYNAKTLTDKMSGWGHEFQKIVNVMEARHKEHLHIIAELLQERAVLKRDKEHLQVMSDLLQELAVIKRELSILKTTAKE